MLVLLDHLAAGSGAAAATPRLQDAVKEEEEQRQEAGPRQPVLLDQNAAIKEEVKEELVEEELDSLAGPQPDLQESCTSLPHTTHHTHTHTRSFGASR
jgi:hypothetical protein